MQLLKLKLVTYYNLFLYNYKNKKIVIILYIYIYIIEKKRALPKLSNSSNIWEYVAHHLLNQVLNKFKFILKIDINLFIDLYLKIKKIFNNQSLH